MAGRARLSLATVTALCGVVEAHAEQLDWLLQRQASLRRGYVLFLSKDLAAIALSSGEVAKDLGLNAKQRQALVAEVHSDVRRQFDFAANIVTPGIKESVLIRERDAAVRARDEATVAHDKVARGNADWFRLFQLVIDAELAVPCARCGRSMPLQSEALLKALKENAVVQLVHQDEAECAQGGDQP